MSGPNDNGIDAAETQLGAALLMNDRLRAALQRAESERVKAVDALTRVEEALADKTDELDAVKAERDAAIAALQRKP